MCVGCMPGAVQWSKGSGAAVWHLQREGVQGRCAERLAIRIGASHSVIFQETVPADRYAADAVLHAPLASPASLFVPFWSVTLATPEGILPGLVGVQVTGISALWEAIMKAETWSSFWIQPDSSIHRCEEHSSLSHNIHLTSKPMESFPCL